MLIYLTFAVSQNVVDDVEHAGHHETLAGRGGCRLQVVDCEWLQRRAQTVVQRGERTAGRALRELQTRSRSSARLLVERLSYCVRVAGGARREDGGVVGDEAPRTVAQRGRARPHHRAVR